MKITNTIEHKDGTVTLNLDMNEEEVGLLIEYAVINLLKEYVEKAKKGIIVDE